MRFNTTRCALALAALLTWTPLGYAQLTDTVPHGYTVLFDGKTMQQWHGLDGLWTIENGCLTGTTTADAPIAGNTFLVYTGEMPLDFEMRLQFRIIGGNSGIQYRSKLMDEAKFVVGGFQADIDSGPTFSGIHYEEKLRGILAQRGERVVIGADGSKQVEQFAKSEDLQKAIKPEEWNDYRIVAKGNHTEHYINDQLMSECTDHQQSPEPGILALQLHAGPPMRVQFRRIYLKPLETEPTAVEPVAPATATGPTDPSKQTPVEGE
jgi:hypothetical protein